MNVFEFFALNLFSVGILAVVHASNDGVVPVLGDDGLEPQGPPGEDCERMAGLERAERVPFLIVPNTVDSHVRADGTLRFLILRDVVIVLPVQQRVMWTED